MTWFVTTHIHTHYQRGQDWAALVENVGKVLIMFCHYALHCIFPLFTTNDSSTETALHSLFSASLNTTERGP
jgi:hypothetical protein